MKLYMEISEIKIKTKTKTKEKFLKAAIHVGRGTAKNTCFLEVFFHKLSQETPIQVSCEVSVSICDNSSGVSVLLET